eukprot:TRINITY_DN12191_c0_g1_i1.p1 TRINITY_DN12191_c0_g1~~TRINITY_DN12191_c0_g1_i1.p1  ORF type:complete len:115 (+),score=23.48 TRINITY_DN12191_c0_g1_i1:457-801(+)
MAVKQAIILMACAMLFSQALGASVHVWTFNNQCLGVESAGVSVIDNTNVCIPASVGSIASSFYLNCNLDGSFTGSVCNNFGCLPGNCISVSGPNHSCVQVSNILTIRSLRVDCN